MHASGEQLQVLKLAGVIPSSAPKCELITPPLTDEAKEGIESATRFLLSNWLLLAAYSTFFEALFFTRIEDFNERNMKQIPVDQVLLENFKLLLSVINPNYAAITVFENLAEKLNSPVPAIELGAVGFGAGVNVQPTDIQLLIKDLRSSVIRPHTPTEIRKCDPEEKMAVNDRLVSGRDRS
ncbi:hypothetical protein DdX_18762 [Ditylenchus destructor]|uniref:BTB domain-containing protein n=1 Tax=Ditylenchus destructor TaxID=166010 RepID=A0AAD4MK48_9BILA|nr:hypothetical protein DdX_18762 [Ditylenchus destructor]